MKNFEKKYDAFADVNVVQYDRIKLEKVDYLAANKQLREMFGGNNVPIYENVL